MSGYKTDCPKCGGNDYYVTPHNGVSHCFHCGYTHHAGSSTQVVEKVRGNKAVIRDFYRFAANYYHSCMTPVARKYLLARGITDTMIDTWRIGYIPTGKAFIYEKPEAVEAGLALTDGTPALADRISFPYLHNGEVVEIRGRAIGPDEVKYKSPFHSSYYRWSDYPYNSGALTSNTTPVITEGEIKTILSVEAGVPAIGLPGMLSWKPIKLRAGIILFDSQRDTRIRRYVQQAIDKCARELSDPYVATLPLNGKDKEDIDEYILQYGKDAYRLIVSLALPYDMWRKLHRR